MSTLVSRQLRIRRQGPGALLRRYTFGFALLLGVVLLAINLILRPNFPIEAQFAAFAPLALAAIASTPAIIAGRGGLDISISPLMTLTSIVYAVWLVPAGLGGFVAAPLLLLVGAVVGAINGLIIVALRLPAVIVTLAMYFILTGLNVRIAPQPVQTGATWLNAFAGSIGFVPGGLVLILVPVVIWVAIRSTAYGRSLYLVGGNDATAYSAGMKVNATRVIAYALGGTFAAFGGMALTGLTSSGAATTSASYTLIAIAAVALGGTSLFGGRGGILGSILGAACIFLVQNLLGSLQVGAVWLQVVYGLMLLVAVVFGAVLSAPTTARARARRPVHEPASTDDSAANPSAEEAR